MSVIIGEASNQMSTLLIVVYFKLLLIMLQTPFVNMEYTRDSGASRRWAKLIVSLLGYIFCLNIN